MNSSRRFVFFVVVICAAFAFNWDFVLCHSLSTMPWAWSDTPGLIQGFTEHPQFLGGLDCWHGPWMYAGTTSQFRPIASHFHWAQIWVGLHMGWFWTGWMTFAVFAVICCGAAALSLRWTRSTWLALLVGVAVAGVRFFNPGHPDRWLAWFPVADFLLSGAFFLWALVAFDVYLTKPSRKALWATWALFLASSLSKEFGYIFSACALCMALFHPCPKAGLRPRLVASSALMAGSLALWMYRRVVLPHARPTDMTISRARAQLEHNELYFAFSSQQWALLALCTLLVVGGLVIWRWPRREVVYGVVGALGAFLVSLLAWEPGFAFEMIEHPARTAYAAGTVLLVPCGTWVCLRSPLGRMSLGVYALMHIPLLGYLHNQLFLYTILPPLLLPVHLSVLLSLMLPASCAGAIKRAG